MAELKASARRVQEVLKTAGQPFEVRQFPDSTRSAAEAAAALGCGVAEIAKSLIFKGRDSGRPVLVIASGANRVDEQAVGRLLGEKIARADADYVRRATGFAIGGVPPVGHLVEPAVLIDSDLRDFARIWAAAGTPNAVFELDPAVLPALTGGRFAAVKAV